MSAITAFGLALLLVSMTILAWVVPNPWAEDIEKDMPVSGQPSELNALIQENRRRRHLRKGRWTLGVGAGLLLVAIFIILQAPVTSPTVINYPVSYGPRPPDIFVLLTPPSPTSVSFWYQPIFYIPVLLISALFIGGILLLARHSAVARASGASLLVAATLSSQFHLIKDFKFAPSVTLGLSAEQVGDIVDARVAKLKGASIEELTAQIELLIGKIDIKGVVNSEMALKLDLINEFRADIKSLLEKLNVNVNIDKTTLEAQIDNYFLQAGELGPEWLGDVQEFDSGQPTFKEKSMKPSVAVICSNWHRRAGSSNKGLVLAVGGTDRIPLSAAAKARYESNAGLARARAEEIKKKIMECGIPENQILAIVSGPRNTPALTRPRADDTGYPKDRMVDVWAIWSWKTPRQDIN
jgi:hypothetical protein